MALRRRVVEAIAVTLITGALLSGCASETMPTPAPAPTSSSPASVAPKTPLEPALVAGGSADENLNFFNHAINTHLVDGGAADGVSLIDALTAAGFDRANMQVTADRTPLGNAVDSVIFSVRLGEDCLVGQVHSGSLTSTVTAALANGACLVGQTRTIDW